MQTSVLLYLANYLLSAPNLHSRDDIPPLDCVVPKVFVEKAILYTRMLMCQRVVMLEDECIFQVCTRHIRMCMPAAGWSFTCISSFPDLCVHRMQCFEEWFA